MDQKEYKIRSLIHRKKALYKRTLIYTLISALTILIWAFTGFGTFWPIWVMFGFTIALIVDAIRVGSINFLKPYLPFLEDDWEEKEVQKLLKSKKAL